MSESKTPEVTEFDPAKVLPKTLDEIAADPFLQECATVERIDGEDGPALRIMVNVTAEMRIPEAVIDEHLSPEAAAAIIVPMVRERYVLDLDLDVWPTLHTKIVQAMKG